jgi:hypothetical protein
MVGDKIINLPNSRKISMNQNNINKEYILDLDELHKNVTPPSELNENYTNTYEIGNNLIFDFKIN